MKEMTSFLEPTVISEPSGFQQQFMSSPSEDITLAGFFSSICRFHKATVLSDETETRVSLFEGLNARLITVNYSLDGCIPFNIISMVSQRNSSALDCVIMKTSNSYYFVHASEPQSFSIGVPCQTGHQLAGNVDGLNFGLILVFRHRVFCPRLDGREESIPGCVNRRRAPGPTSIPAVLGRTPQYV